MKPFLLVLFVVISSPVRAESVDVLLADVRLMEFAKLYFTAIAKENYVLDSAALGDTSLITVEARKVDQSALADTLRALLEEKGFAWSKRGPLNLVTAAKPVSESEYGIWIYRPKFRSVSYLASLTSPLLEKGRFTFQRAVSSNAEIEHVPQTDSKAVDVEKLPKRRTADSGTSAQSLKDKDADIAVFHGPPNEVERVQKLFAELDVPAGEVLVKGVVFEVSTDQSDVSAINLALSLLSGKVSFGLGGAELPNFVRLSTGGLDLVVSALASDSRFKVMSSPRLRVRSGEVAKVTVGTETPVLGEVTIAENGQLVQSIDYRPSGVILDLEPVVMSGSVDLRVRQQLSEFVRTASGVNNSPTLLKREVSTALSVQPGEVVVLGGLDQQKESEDSTGISFLPRWMRSNGETASKSELVILLEVTRL